MSEMANSVLTALSNLSREELLGIAEAAAMEAEHKLHMRWSTAKETIEQLAFEFDMTPRALVDALFPETAPPPKYRSPDHAKTWSGKGVMPKWLRELCVDGKTPDDFLSVQPTAVSPEPASVEPEAPETDEWSEPSE